MNKITKISTPNVLKEMVETLGPNCFIEYLNINTCESKRVRLVVRKDGKTYYRVSKHNVNSNELSWFGFSSVKESIKCFNGITV